MLPLRMLFLLSLRQTKRKKSRACRNAKEVIRGGRRPLRLLCRPRWGNDLLHLLQDAVPSTDSLLLQLLTLRLLLSPPTATGRNSCAAAVADAASAAATVVASAAAAAAVIMVVLLLLLTTPDRLAQAGRLQNCKH